MKIYIFLLTIIFISSCISITKEPYRNEMDIVIRALNEHNSSMIKPFISKDFEWGEVKINNRENMLNQIITGYPYQIESYNIDEINSNGKTTTLIVTLNRRGKPANSYSFILDNQNKFTNLGVFVFEKKEQKVEIPSTLIDKDFFKTEFEIFDGIIVINASINGEDKKFILDTGSPQLILDKDLYKSIPAPKLQAKGAAFDGNISDINFTKINNFQFGLTKKNDFEAIVMDISRIKKELDIDIAGLIGFEEIKDFEIVLDYQNNQFWLFRLDENGEKKKQVHLGDKNKVISFVLLNHLPIIEVTDLKQNMYNFALDSGAAVNLMLEKHKKNIVPYYKKVRIDTLRSVESQQREIEVGEIFRLRIGDYWYEKMLTSFTDLANLSSLLDNNIDGVLGYEFLHKNKIAINYKKNKIYILD